MQRLLATVLVLVTGCSFALTHGPTPGRAPDRDPACSRSPAGPVLDVIFVALAGAMAVTAQQRHEDYMPPEDPLPGNIAEGDHNPAVRNFAIGVGIVGLAGAVYGFTQMSRCQRAYNEYWKHAQP